MKNLITKILQHNCNDLLPRSNLGHKVSYFYNILTYNSLTFFIYNNSFNLYLTL